MVYCDVFLSAKLWMEGTKLNRPEAQGIHNSLILMRIKRSVEDSLIYHMLSIESFASFSIYEFR